MSINELKERIENMAKYHQIEVLRILNKNASVYTNENHNGTFINLTEQTDEVIKSLEAYANYVDEQQQQLNRVECEKDIIEKTFFKSVGVKRLN
jgi:hypothetical protein